MSIMQIFDTKEISFTIGEVERLIELAKLGDDGMNELNEELETLNVKLEKMENYEKNPSEKLKKVISIHGGGASYESVCRFNIKRIKERIEETEAKKTLLLELEDLIKSTRK